MRLWRWSFLWLVGLLLALLAVELAYAQSAVSMTAVEFAFQPSEATVSSGTVTFSLRNAGQFPHNIHIDGMASDVFAENVTAGQAASARVTLAPGTYMFWCPVGNHRDRGMEGTLIVAGAAAARAGGMDPIVTSVGIAALGIVVLAAGVWRRRSSA